MLQCGPDISLTQLECSNTFHHFHQGWLAVEVQNLVDSDSPIGISIISISRESYICNERKRQSSQRLSNLPVKVTSTFRTNGITRFRKDSVFSKMRFTANRVRPRRRSSSISQGPKEFLSSGIPRGIPCTYSEITYNVALSVAGGEEGINITCVHTICRLPGSEQSTNTD